MFKTHNMVDFDICIHLRNHHQNHINEHARYHQKCPCDPFFVPSSCWSRPSIVCFLSLLIKLYFLEFYINVILQYALLLLSMLILRFTHVVAGIESLFLFITE